ncbi:hypothetical protein TTHERM_00251200 (macronuclear) [Tetrahymena thermophila SB210]|uniref:Uncharacterized protein n=1 Tax=Tetrahymena thermophila (strain SB210) TaxID=312017 RepID=Q23QR3_TETTS|nr:hypothetical protein TTHERM_00251200 [Tetrahymena thermophila SB210]EAR98825.1 hypothetical protein TTHERM_00251200 [Tetrahymena thermophila SB210]|eukprot:XP_001019070.1 hypothetical protein TTHERM_00251200 [Tetrahymena thermophila SB210]
MCEGQLEGEKYETPWLKACFCEKKPSNQVNPNSNWLYEYVLLFFKQLCKSDSFVNS